MALVFGQINLAIHRLSLTRMDNVAYASFIMNVNLTPELTQLVQNKVRTGRYNSAAEVVREALSLLEARDQLKSVQKEEIRNKIAAGLSSLNEGKGIDGEAFFAQMEAELDEEIRLEDERSSKESIPILY